MKEDIEIIKKHYVFTTNHTLDDENKRFKQAIENLIKAYKELERENQMLKNTKNNCPHLSTSGVSCNIKDSISKDKIKEKINELEIELKDEKYTHDMYEGTIKYDEYLGLVAKHNILEELLEE